MSQIRGLVYLLDDDPGVIRALTRLLMSAGYGVRGFTSPAAFLKAWEPVSRCCLVLDITMPEINGLKFQELLRHQGVLLPIVFLTGNGDIPTTVLAMKGGAVDFLTKPVRKVDLIRAIESSLTRSETLHETASKAMNLNLLTPREREVMKHVVAGKLNKQIAAELGTGIQNIKLHRSRIMRKMGVESLADLVRLAGSLGIGQEPGEGEQAKAEAT